MTSKEIYDGLCKFRDSDQKEGSSPSKLVAKGVSVNNIPDNTEDLISHTQYSGTDGGTVEEIITSYDHSRTMELRPDSNHFKIILHSPDGKVSSKEFTNWDME